MSTVTEIAILVLAAFVGFEVISKVPNTLHTPLMSGTNAIHGIVLLGGLLLMHEAQGVLEHVLLVIAITFGTINVIGGFFVTDRMLGMFKRGSRRRPKRARSSDAGHVVRPASELHRLAVHSRVRAVHLRDERADGPAHRRARQQDRRDRHGDRRDRDAADSARVLGVLDAVADRRSGW